MMQMGKSKESITRDLWRWFRQIYRRIAAARAWALKQIAVFIILNFRYLNIMINSSYGTRDTTNQILALRCLTLTTCSFLVLVSFSLE